MNEAATVFTHDNSYFPWALGFRLWDKNSGRFDSNYFSANSAIQTLKEIPPKVWEEGVGAWEGGGALHGLHNDRIISI